MANTGLTGVDWYMWAPMDFLQNAGPMFSDYAYPCGFPPSITHKSTEHDGNAQHDDLVEWALASITAGDIAAAAGPNPNPKDPNACVSLRQAHLSIRQGGL